MIYGRENPLVYTPQEIFNPTTAQMELNTMNQYVQALREDYKDNLARQEEFLKEYGSFYSPIEKDAENYYNYTTGGIARMFEEAEKQGVDLLRSLEGRALIQRYIANRPYAKLAMLKQSAENAQAYQKAYGELYSRGLLSEDMVKHIDGDLKDWDTLNGSGIWAKTSPTQYKSYTDMLAPIKNMLKGEYDYLRTDRKRWKDIFGVSDDRVREALNAGMSDLLAQPQMQYYLDTEFKGDKDALREEMYKRLRDSLGEDERTNERLKAEYEQGQANARAAAERNTQLQIAGIKAGANGDKDGSNSYRYNINKSANDLRMPVLNYLYDKIANHIVYDSTKHKNIKFKDLSEDQKLKLASDPNSNVGKLYAQYMMYEKYGDAYRNNILTSDQIHKYENDTLRELINRHIAKGGYARTASLAFAINDSAKQFVSQFSSDDDYSDENGKIVGYKATGRSFYTIGEVSARTGMLKGVSGRLNSKNDALRSKIKYFTVEQGASGDLIQQYENADHRRHNYRKVRAHLDDGTTRIMWMETFSPDDKDSPQAQAHDNDALGAVGQNTKAIETPMNTI